jgi:hypothetical protein
VCGALARLGVSGNWIKLSTVEFLVPIQERPLDPATVRGFLCLLIVSPGRKLLLTIMLQVSAIVGTDCVKTRHEISLSKFDRAGCAVSHDRLSGMGRGIP